MKRFQLRILLRILFHATPQNFAGVELLLPRATHVETKMFKDGEWTDVPARNIAEVASRPPLLLGVLLHSLEELPEWRL